MNSVAIPILLSLLLSGTLLLHRQQAILASKLENLKCFYKKHRDRTTQSCFITDRSISICSSPHSPPEQHSHW